MNKRKWLTLTTCILVALLLATGYMAIAAEYGSDADPLVSASYITEVLAPQTIDKVNEIIDQRTSEFTTQLNQTLADYTAHLDSVVEEVEGTTQDLASDSAFVDAVATQVLSRLNSTDSSVSVSGGWTLLEVSEGETVVFEAGGMAMLRVGTANCYTPSSTNLVDITDSSELANGEPLVKNHMYVVTISGRGFTVTASSAKLMVYGSYTKTTDPSSLEN